MKRSGFCFLGILSVEKGRILEEDFKIFEKDDQIFEEDSKIFEEDAPIFEEGFLHLSGIFPSSPPETGHFKARKG